MPRYSVTHRTRYTHSTPVGSAWQSLHLQPRKTLDQRLRPSGAFLLHCGYQGGVRLVSQ